MKKSTILIIFVLSAKISFPETPQQMQNLASFAQVWGFLKYYHSEASKGNPDWDKELLKMIPLVKQAGTQQAYDAILLKWYALLPKSKLSGHITQVKTDSIVRIFNENDIRQFPVPHVLKTELVKLYLYHQPDSSKYITNRYKEYTLDYISHNEDPYEKPAYPAEEYRLLALFRYWNIINYFYPYKLINTSDWNSVLDKYIPKFIDDNNADDYRNTFRMLVTELKDSHSWFAHREWSDAHEKMNLPFAVYYVKGKYVIGESQYDSLMKANDFRMGDEVVSINNQPIVKRIEQLAPYITGTNKLSYYRNIGQHLFKIDSNRNIRIGFRRNNILINKSLQLNTEAELYEYRKTHQPQWWEQMEKGIWHVRICRIGKADTLQKLFEDIKDARCVIWDMRDYPNFNVVQAVRSGFFADSNKTSINYNAMLFYPGAFLMNSGVSYTLEKSAPLTLYKGKMIVLVNEFTQSLAESVVSELRFRPNTLVMGRQTAGTTGNIVWVGYPGGIYATFTGVGVKGMNNSFTEKKGVTIDRTIDLSIKKLASGKDYVLGEAMLEALK